MMGADILEASVAFEQFSLNFRVQSKDSIEWTKWLQSRHGKEAVFAAGEIWVRRCEESTLLIEQDPGSNLIAYLSTLKHEVRFLRAIPGLEERINLGGWCQWMRGYWERLKSDIGAPEDEATCSLLMPALFMDGKNGWIALYRYNETPIVEVGTRSAKLSIWSELDPDALDAAVNAAMLHFSDAICAGVEHQCYEGVVRPSKN